jgi:hypothetical protein
MLNHIKKQQGAFGAASVSACSFGRTSTSSAIEYGATFLAAVVVFPVRSRLLPLIKTVVVRAGWTPAVRKKLLESEA